MPILTVRRHVILFLIYKNGVKVLDENEVMATGIRRNTYAAREIVPRRYQPHCEKAEQLSALHLSRLVG